MLEALGRELSELPAENPLFGVTLTVFAYVVAAAFQRLLGGAALVHPVLVSALLVGSVLVVTGIDYEIYFIQVFPLHVALGLVVTLFAVPLFRQLSAIHDARTALGTALLVGGVTALATSVAWPLLANAATETLATLAPRASTTAFAVQISEAGGGVAAITALIVVSTGVAGAVIGPPLLHAAGVVDHRAVGFALGVASHAIGTARAFQISEVAGAFSTLGMILNAILTAILVPILLYVI
ncbi:MAG: LrgB family protein [Pseudomonadota bacterium]